MERGLRAGPEPKAAPSSPDTEPAARPAAADASPRRWRLTAAGALLLALAAAALAWSGRQRVHELEAELEQRGADLDGEL